MQVTDTIPLFVALMCAGPMHDALIEPLRDYLDQQRVDFSQSEIIAIVDQVFESGTISDTLRTSLKFLKK